MHRQQLELLLTKQMFYTKSSWEQKMSYGHRRESTLNLERRSAASCEGTSWPQDSFNGMQLLQWHSTTVVFFFLRNCLCFEPPQFPPSSFQFGLSIPCIDIDENHTKMRFSFWTFSSAAIRMPSFRYWENQSSLAFYRQLTLCSPTHPLSFWVSVVVTHGAVWCPWFVLLFFFLLSFCLFSMSLFTLI